MMIVNVSYLLKKLIHFDTSAQTGVAVCTVCVTTGSSTTIGVPLCLFLEKPAFCYPRAETTPT